VRDSVVFMIRRYCPACGVVPGNGSVTVVPEVGVGCGVGDVCGVGRTLSRGIASMLGVGAVG
jgi:hypothetical protein